MKPRTIPIILALALVSPALAQSSLLEPDVPVGPVTEPVPNAHLRGVSLMLVEPPEPRTFAVHDIVTIIVDESTRAESSQDLETEKEFDLAAALVKFPSLRALVDGRLETGDSSPVVEVDINADREFEGEGEYEREDRFVTRITAEVIDVKPNGVLVLEARKRIAKDQEIQTVVLAGKCRSEDVTAQNTVLSSQLADLQVAMTNEGELKKAGSKGFITRAFETVFNF